LKYILGQFSKKYSKYQSLAELAALEIRTHLKFEELWGIRRSNDELLNIILDASPFGTVDIVASTHTLAINNCIDNNYEWFIGLI
jgi:hypothetical protein